MTTATSKCFNGIELTTHQAVQLAIRCAESVLPIFEAAHPTEQRPRAAIQAARAWLLDPSDEQAEDARAAACAAWSAADSAGWAADDAASAWAGWAAADAAWAADAAVAWSAADAVAWAADSAAHAARAAAAPMQARPGDMISIPLLEGSLQTCLLLLDTDIVLTPDGQVEELTNELRFVLTLPAA
jgi:hypothetical protein